MKLVFKISVLFVLLFSANVFVFACSCVDPSQRERYRMSKVVFLGEVIEIKDSNESSEDLKFFSYSVEFKVEKQWKGKKSKEITILADYDEPRMCGDLNLKVGERFLMYSEKRYGKLVVNQDCSISRNAKYADDEIKKLNNFFFKAYYFLFPFPKI
ncbi:MAG TPA: hypothetical protein PKE69_06535 [Pyrinomonadaceae bacterium]|nr:hypothetical protein [Pyrinomonadaceae bacterium]